MAVATTRGSAAAISMNRRMPWTAGSSVLALATSPFRMPLSKMVSNPTRECASHPDRAVAAQRSNLEDGASVHQAREDVQEFALTWRDADRREARGLAGLECGFERAVSFDQGAGEVGVNGGPLIVAHAQF